MRVLLSFGFSFLALAPCDVPVYRYALEHWPAEPYVLVLGSGGGARDPAEAPILEALGRAVREGANLEIRREEGFGPGAVLRYPESAGIGRPVWEGRLADLVAEELVCSPLRRSVARMIEEGAAAVWILLESGAPGKDEEVARFLESRLRDVPAGPCDGAGEAPAVRPVFPVLRLSRKDPAEKMLVRMLLRSEEGLEAAAGPMVFPVFGRGRKLEALVGKGITAENVDEYVAFLTGPCSCRVKQQAPGVDLLMAANWGTGRADPSIGAVPRETIPPSGAPGLFAWGWIGLGVAASGAAAAGALLLFSSRPAS